jgi:hypothetical protein
MKSLDEIREIIRQHRNLIADKYGVDVVGIFGSYVRSEQERQSDIDLLAEILRPISLLEMVGAEIYLSETLGIKVDLVPKRSVNLP